MRNFITIVLAAMLTLVSAHVLADNTQQDKLKQIYKVELIVFKYNSALSNEKLSWQTATHASDFPDAISLLPNMQTDTEALAPNLYQLLPANAFDLSAITNRISRNHRYGMLLQAAWYMPINQVKTIYLSGGTDYANTGIWELDGTVTLSQNNYINVKTKFALTEQIDGVLKTASMQESRRMREGQLTYLDSPIIGILIKVLPLATTAPHLNPPP